MNTRTHDNPTLYQTLGIDPSAGGDQIREAYRALAKRLHPDVDPRPGAAERFRAVLHAYEVLTSSESRRAYDAELRRTRDAGSGLTSPGAAHYSWQNIAARTNDVDSQGVRRHGDVPQTDFDMLYDTFFRPMAERLKQNRQADPEMDA
ncbi:MAG: DnaJ domain-containing protein [Phycisphaeraceae bacterium]|nr:DnaJ domain-containing protein [Phycisphaeraceae bacterium]